MLMFLSSVCVLQEKRISSLDAANSRLMSALTQVKERYSMHNLRNGLSPTNPTKLSITENGEFKNSSCWSRLHASTDWLTTVNTRHRNECLLTDVYKCYLILVMYRNATAGGSVLKWSGRVKHSASSESVSLRLFLFFLNTDLLVNADLRFLIIA